MSNLYPYFEDYDTFAVVPISAVKAEMDLWWIKEDKHDVKA